jgi:hypothetical protein
MVTTIVQATILLLAMASLTLLEPEQSGYENIRIGRMRSTL